MTLLHTAVPAVRTRLDGLGQWLAPLGLRLLLAWEFLESGLEKWRGENWFGSIQDAFPPPLRWLSAEANWQAATWLELVGAVCLLLGVATRASAAMLIGVTVVATAAVHWPADWESLAGLAGGYAITDSGQGNFKLPLLFIAMLLPLLFHGAGRCSVDALLAGRREAHGGRSDPLGWGMLGVLAAGPVSWLLPGAGLTLLLLGAALLAWAWRSARHAV